MKKLISLCVMLVLVIGLVGCGGKSPSQAVSDSLNAIKKGENKEFSDTLARDILQEKNDSKITSQVLDSTKNITYKVNSEKKDGDNATVNVTVNGPDVEDAFSKVISKAVDKMLSRQESGKRMTKEELTDLFADTLKEVLADSENTERTMDIDLVKEDKQWKVKDEKQLVKLVVNLDEDSLDKLFKK